MAFRTNKVPAIEERTVSGSSVSFNSAFALPLKACKVSFSATQSGSGTPSPQNVRPIIPVSSVDLLANSVSVIVPLGDSYGGGTLDLLTGECVITDVIPDLSQGSFSRGSKGSGGTGYYFYTTTAFANTLPLCKYNASQIVQSKAKELCSHGIIENGYNNDGNMGWAYADEGVRTIIRFAFDDIQTIEDFDAIKSSLQIRYPLAEPITIQLSANDLSSIIGNNTFSTDTGTLEITFADLQEKSASGAVASFNTALAMPLASCYIAVNAYQEGSGDPSPVNVRPIHGFDKVRINVANFNQLVKNGNFVGTTTWGSFDAYCTMSVDNNECSLTFVDVVDSGYINGVSCPIHMIPTHKYFWSNDLYSPRNGEARLYNIGNSVVKNKTVVSGWNKLETIMNGSFATEGNKACYWGLVNCLTNGFEVGDIYKIKNVCIFDLTQMFGVKLADYLYSLEQQTAGAGVAVFRQLFYKDYYDYNVGGTWVSVASVNGNSYPDYAQIQLGQEVYGAEVDVVNGVAHCTHGYREFDGTENWVATTVSGFPCFQIARGDLPTSAQFISNYIKRVVAMTASEFIGYVGGSNFNVRFTSDTTLEQFQEILSNDNMQIVYELATPFEIQLTPTQIETLIGNNTIFADTGDIDLTYKDLDIAKRGNFREVFKLPS